MIFPAEIAHTSICLMGNAKKSSIAMINGKTDDFEKATKINTFFTNVASNLASSIPPVKWEHPDYYHVIFNQTVQEKNQSTLTICHCKPWLSDIFSHNTTEDLSFMSFHTMISKMHLGAHGYNMGYTGIYEIE